MNIIQRIFKTLAIIIFAILVLGNYKIYAENNVQEEFDPNSLNAIRDFLQANNLSEERQTTEFTDAMENTDYYSNPEGISRNEARKVEKMVGKILSIITNIGIVISVIMPAILGIKYMISSLEEKAEYKRDMIPYFVGAVLLFGVCTIVKIIQNIGQSINKS